MFVFNVSDYTDRQEKENNMENNAINNVMLILAKGHILVLFYRTVIKQ